MDTKELIKKVRKIEIRTKGLSKNIFSGEYHSAFKGKGMAFSEVREYQFGDDVRSIDWNVTARFNHPFVKIFEEERELNLMLLIDLSASSNFGTDTKFKRELITELSAVLSFSALQNNDKIGVIFFSDIIEKFIPPKKGKTHVLRIISELLNFQPKNTKTNISEAVRYLLNVIKKRSIVFLVSDFFDENFEQPLKIASKKHDTIAMQVWDKRESELTDSGLMYIQDSETGDYYWLDSSNKKLRDNYNKYWLSRQENLNELFKKAKVDSIKIRTDESYIKPLMNFFKSRGNSR